MSNIKPIKDATESVTQETVFSWQFWSFKVARRSKVEKPVSGMKQASKMLTKVINIKTTIGACVLIIMVGCTKLVEVDPPVTRVNADNVYTNDATATAVLTGMYSRMSQVAGGFAGIDGVSVRTGLSADEFSLYSNVNTPRLLAYYRNELSAVTGFGTEYWSVWYQQIYYCNAAIEGLTMSNTLSQSVKNQLIGEAKFLRAFFHFYLSNLFGDVPIIMTTDYVVNSQVSKMGREKVLQQIVTDLKEAEELLSENFLNGSLQTYTGSPERVRPSKWAAKALLARAYLYQKDYAKAEVKSTEVIIASVFGLSDIANVFLRAGLGNKEAIWQIQPVMSGWNTEDAKVFVIAGPIGNSRPIQLSKKLLDAFEPGDKRRLNWVRDTVINGSQVKYVFKYKRAKLNESVMEYLMVLRLAEQYLIRAEARANLNKLPEAVDDLNTLRARSRAVPTVEVPDPLPTLNVVGLSQVKVLEMVMAERRLELFSEYGHRWFDLKRTNNIDMVMAVAAPIKGGVWKSFKNLYPIANTEIERNMNMIQNTGY